MPEYQGQAAQFPQELTAQRRLLRSLMNVRPPMPLKQDFLAVQDEMLSAEAAKKGLKSVAFCCISTGEFHFPNDLAAEIAVGTVTDFLKGDSSIQKVIFNVFKDFDRECYEGRLGFR